MSSDLNPQKALIFRITHRDNIPWMLDNGLHCRNSKIVDPKYVEIGNPELIEKRRRRIVPEPPGGTLRDYVPFYFTPFSPMLLNIRTGHNGIRKHTNDEIVIMVSSLHTLRKKSIPFLFTDRHANLKAAQFSSDLTQLNWIDWPSLQRRDFKKDDSDKFERYQAEALVHKHMPIDAVVGIVAHSDSVTSALKELCVKRSLDVALAARPRWYFR
jgi:hypothetical protein